MILPVTSSSINLPLSCVHINMSSHLNGMREKLGIKLGFIDCNISSTVTLHIELFSFFKYVIAAFSIFSGEGPIKVQIRFQYGLDIDF